MAEEGDPGGFWEREDAAEAKRVEDEKRARAERILRAQAEAASAKKQEQEGCAPNGHLIPTAASFDEAMDDLVMKTCEALETLDDGITLLHEMASDTFMNNRIKKKKNKKSKKKQNDDEAAATREVAMVQEDEKDVENTEEEEKNGGFGIFFNPFAKDPPAGKEQEFSKKKGTSKVDLADSSEDDEDLDALEAEIGHYIDMLQKHKETTEEVAKEEEPEDELMGVLKQVEQKQKMKDMQQSQLIWDYVGDDDVSPSGVVRRGRTWTKQAPSPENILGRMKKKETEESEDVKEARITKMLDALDKRMAAQAAARRNMASQSDEESSGIQKRDHDPYDDGLIYGIIDDLKVFSDIGEKIVRDDCGVDLSMLRLSDADATAKALEEADETFYQEIKEASKGSASEKNAKKNALVQRNNGLFSDTRDALLDIPNACLGMEDTASHVENTMVMPAQNPGAARTVADNTNAVDSTDAAFATEENNFQGQDAPRDPPATSWFSFLSPSSPQSQKDECSIPSEIDTTPEELRQKAVETEPEPEIAKSVVSRTKKGLKITAILEENDYGNGTANQPILVAESHDEGFYADALPCWNLHQQQRQLMNE